MWAVWIGAMKHGAMHDAVRCKKSTDYIVYMMQGRQKFRVAEFYIPYMCKLPTLYNTVDVLWLFELNAREFAPFVPYRMS